MLKNPVVVEVRVEKEGLFIVTTSILMCGDDDSAKQAYRNQQEMAEALMDTQGFCFLSSEEMNNSFWTGKYNAR